MLSNRAREAGGHRLKNRQRQAFELGDVEEDVRRKEHGDDVFLPWKARHDASEAEFAHAAVPVLSESAVADPDESRGRQTRGDQLCLFEEFERALLRDEPTYCDDE